MTLLRRVITTFVILLLVTLGIGNLWSIEINKSEGRPWDSGHIIVVNYTKQGSVSEKNPNQCVALPGNSKMFHESSVQYFRSFEVFLSDILSFLY